MKPLYLECLAPADIHRRAEQLFEKLVHCDICPNSCKMNRSTNKTGICNAGMTVKVSSYGAHFGEEPPLVGTMGSGTVFLTHCNMKCVFCQNYDISHLGDGYEISVDTLADIALSLQSNGCHNINFVSPTHFVTQILKAIALAVDKGLEIPLVYNSGGYENVEILKVLENIFDIYMPDMKYADNQIAQKYSGVDNYADAMYASVKEMHRQTGDLKCSKMGIAQRGLIIRHLVMPNNIAHSRKILDFVAKEISLESYINIMDQYRPAYQVLRYPELNRRITEKEYMDIVMYAKEVGLFRGLEIL